MCSGASGKHGNKNSGRELEKGTKYEWTTSLELLKKIAGNLEVVEGKEANTLIEKIANAKEKLDVLDEFEPEKGSAL